MNWQVRRHNRRVNHRNWWRRYFWFQDEYYAKFAVYRAAAFCEEHYGLVPELIKERPIKKSVWALSSAKVNKWLNTVPPYKRRR
ncbi:hypothetical protein B9G39_15740 [Zooshikella ganghwensis]|uniref:Uncharacterized protein n=1 Tax=Zooshikella ganghwensis TaxID=202772 RepID=A0A4P9VMW5_9GAMM|nr:hypothetical protein B9G39_15740 [Zooshikella ganghwensis]